MIKRVLKIAALLVAFLAVTAAGAYLTLTLIIQSEKTVIVPELVGKEVVIALELLTGLELDIKVKGSEYNSTVPKHHVIFQHPPAGAEIKKGRDVKIILSKGAETVYLPNLTGMSSQQARLILDGEGLCSGDLSRSHHPLVADDHVIAQYPFAGAAIVRNRCVNLLISNGPTPQAFMMPPVAGMPLDEAVLLLELEKLRIDQVESRLDKSRPADIVLEQEPGSGARITRSSPIRLVVNRASAGNAAAETGSAGRMHLFRYRTESGYLRKHVRIEIGAGGKLDELFDDFVKPKTEIWLAVPAGDRDRVFVYENDQLVQREAITGW